MIWSQVYDPMGSMLLSTLLGALPVVVLLGAIGIFEMKAHYAALLGLACSLAVAVLGFGMPTGMAGMSAVYGAAFGLLPIGWIVLNVIFLYQLTNEKGEFDVLRNSIRGLSDDKRLQLLFIAFCFGAFFEGAAGFGTPVAVTAAMLIGLGFSPLAASGGRSAACAQSAAGCTSHRIAAARRHISASPQRGSCGGRCHSFAPASWPPRASSPRRRSPPRWRRRWPAP